MFRNSGNEVETTHITRLIVFSFIENISHFLFNSKGIKPETKTLDSPELLATLVSHLKKRGAVRYIRKGENVLCEGEQVDYVFFVESGFFRAYSRVGDEEITLGFSFEGDIDMCPKAFVCDAKSITTIEALSDAIIIVVNRQELEKLQQDYPEYKSLLKNLLGNYVEVLIQRNIDLQIKTAEDRYIDLHNRQPKELGQIPLTFIASFLDFSKQIVSRIRQKFKSIN